MIIYNVTTMVAHSIVPAWLEWMKSTHIPAIIDTGCFTHAVICELLDTDITEGLTYAVQFHANTEEQYQQYIQQHAGALREDALNKWGKQIISFRSVLKVLK